MCCVVHLHPSPCIDALAYIIFFWTKHNMARAHLYGGASQGAPVLGWLSASQRRRQPAPAPGFSAPAPASERQRQPAPAPASASARILSASARICARAPARASASQRLRQDPQRQRQDLGASASQRQRQPAPAPGSSAPAPPSTPPTPAQRRCCTKPQCFHKDPHAWALVLILTFPPRPSSQDPLMLPRRGDAHI